MLTECQNSTDWNEHLRCQLHVTPQVCSEEETLLVPVSHPTSENFNCAVSKYFLISENCCVSCLSSVFCEEGQLRFLSTPGPAAEAAATEFPLTIPASASSHLCTSYKWNTSGSAKRLLVIRLRRWSKEKWSASRHTLSWQFTSYEWLKLPQSSVTAVRWTFMKVLICGKWFQEVLIWTRGYCVDTGGCSAVELLVVSSNWVSG